MTVSPTARLGLLLEIAHETASDSLRAEAVFTATGAPPPHTHMVAGAETSRDPVRDALVAVPVYQLQINVPALGGVSCALVVLTASRAVQSSAPRSAS